MVKSLLLSLTFFSIVLNSINAKEMDPKQITKAYHTSYQLEKKQKYDQALSAIKEVLTNYEKGYTVNFRAGWLYYLKGKYANALRYYKKALLVVPSSIEIMASISLIHVARTDWKKVLEENYKIIKFDYYNLTANYWYCYALKIQGNLSLAEKVARKMLAVYPTSLTFLNELGEIHYFQKKYKASKSLFNSIVILDPTNVNADKYLRLLKKKK